jgi:hypothetical protein
MNKPSGWDEAPAKSFSGNRPPAGAYVFGILKAQVLMSTHNEEMMVLSLDIVEGDFKGYYREQTERFSKDRLLKHYRLTESEKSIPYFKGDIKTIEESNPGFVFDFDETSLRGKYVGGMLSEEEYEDKDGNIRIKLRVAFLCSVKKATSGTLKIPELKQLNGQPKQQKTPEDDLPF